MEDTRNICYHITPPVVGQGATGIVWLAERVTHAPDLRADGCLPIDDPNILDSVKNQAHLEWYKSGETLDVIIKKIPLPLVPLIGDEIDNGKQNVTHWKKLRKQMKKVMGLSHENVLLHYSAQLLRQQIRTSRKCLLFVERCEEGNLEHHLWSLFENDRRIPLSDYGAQILKGLRHIHDAGVVHKDLKAANIFVTSKNGKIVLKIGDFGEMSVILQNMTTPNTCPGTEGTPYFMSNEMLENEIGGAAQVGRLTDIYSFGCVLLQLVGTDTFPRDGIHHVPRFFRVTEEGNKAYYLSTNSATAGSVDGALGATGSTIGTPRGTIGTPMGTVRGSDQVGHVNRALRLHHFLTDDGGQIEITHSPRLAVIKEPDGYFAVRPPSSAYSGTELREWIVGQGHQDGWPDFAMVIDHCLTKLRSPTERVHHDYEHSRRNGPDSPEFRHVRPITHHLLSPDYTPSVFSWPDTNL